MKKADDDPVAALGCVQLVQERRSQVVILASVLPAYQAFDEVKRERLVRVMRLWCQEQALTKEMINVKEGRCPKTNTMLQTFKTFKHRLYGFVRDVGGLRTFVIVDYDPAKKRDAADQSILKRAKGRVDTLGRGKEHD